MTALVGVFGPGARHADVAIPRLLDKMRARGTGDLEIWHGPGAIVAARCHPWEAALEGWVGPLVSESDVLVTAADASLYYQSDLRRKLARFRDPNALVSGAQLVQAAADTWGPRFATHLEGDFAVLVWEKATRRLTLARDFLGRRSIAYTTLTDGTIVVASSPQAVVAFPGVLADYDLDVLSASAAGLMAYGDRTAYRRVELVPGGVTLTLAEDGRAQTVDQWTPPAFSDNWNSAPDLDAARELRALLERATRERLPTSGRASIWMSGGWDSTSIFAAGRAAIAREASTCELLPVSITYPPGDSGNEDHFIRAVAERWSANVTWVRSDDISLFDDDGGQRVAMRDDPLVHHFEVLQRVLGRTSRSLDTRIVLDGFGGDLIFHASDSVLADHLMFGRWATMGRGWWRRRDRSPKAFFRNCIVPFLPLSAYDWIRTVSGRTVPGPLDLAPPPWMTPRESLLRDSRPRYSRRPDESVCAFEARLLMTHPYSSRVLAWTHAFALDEGFQLRSPLFDSRVIAFAASRPLNERNDGRETKILLRAAMRGLVPDSVLARRPKKTGTTQDYYRRQLGAALPRVFLPLGDTTTKPLILEELGLIDRSRLASAMFHYQSQPDHLLGAQLFTTLEAERWLATHPIQP